jgi:hypothetical protein
MRTKTLVVFRSKSIGFEEEKMESMPIPPLHTVWEPSVVMEEQIQALATRGLLRPKVEVSWRPAAGETVVFLMHIKQEFRVLVGDFFCGLLFF